MLTRQHIFSFRPHAQAMTLPLAAILSAFLFIGCSRTAVPPLEQREETIKRVARNGSLDYFHHWTRTAYVNGKDKPPSGPFSADQEDILSVLGQPDYVRRRFVSQFNEVTGEWVYIQQNHLFQFVGGKQVHSQVVTDVERTLIRFGYPNYSYGRLLDNGRRRQTFVYRDWLGRKIELFSFVDGEMLVGSR